MSFQRETILNVAHMSKLWHTSLHVHLLISSKHTLLYWSFFKPTLCKALLYLYLLSLCKKAFFMPFSTSIKMPKTHFLNHFAHLLTHLTIFHYEKFKACESFGACTKLLLLSLSLSWLPCLTHETSTLIFSLLDFKRTTNFEWNSKNVSIPMHFQILFKVCSFLSTMLTSSFKPLCPVFCG
jgi:hypothetical protein